MVLGPLYSVQPNAVLHLPLETGATQERRLEAVRCRVEPMVAHPAPPQTRTGAMHAYGSSSRASAAPGWQSNGGLVTRLVSAESLSCVCPLHALPDAAFPPVGRLGLTSPRSAVLYDATTATLSLAGCFACRSPPRYLACSLRSWCPRRAHGPVEAPCHARAFGQPVPSSPALEQGDRRLSHVPESPL
jgi:hypothetical protein